MPNRVRKGTFFMNPREENHDFENSLKLQQVHLQQLTGLNVRGMSCPIP